MKNHLADRIKGVIFGQAVGNALGLTTEFLSKDQIQEYYPKGVSRYAQKIDDEHRNRWQAGDWTNDTEQLLFILDSILEKKELDYRNVAQRLHHWAFQEDTKGIGNTVFKVLTQRNFLENPHEASKTVWEDGNKQMAANGAIMRTAILGIWQYDKPLDVKINTENVARITHYDPRCVGSSVALATIISALLRGETNVETLLNLAQKQAVPYDSRLAEAFTNARSKPIEEFELGDPDTSGYTIKALSAALWALKQNDFEKAILKVIHEGGDADSNAAVAGAVLGAKLGFSQIPTIWIDELNKKTILDQRIEKLLALMNVDIANQRPVEQPSFWTKLTAILKTA